MGGNIEIVNLMIQKGADNWSFGLGEACWKGNVEIVNLLIQKGATSCGWCDGTKHQF